MNETHGRVHPNLCYVTDLLVVDLHSSLAYFIMMHPLPVTSKLPIKKKKTTLVAKQLLTNIHTHLQYHIIIKIPCLYLLNVVMHDLSIYIITQYIQQLNTMIYYFIKLKQSHSCTPLLFTDVVLLFTDYPRCYPMGYTFTTLP